MSTRSSSELTTLKLTIALYGIAFSVKITGFLMTGIMVLLADALHSLSDLFIYGFLLVALTWSRREPDEFHMFGYGRAQNVGALVADRIAERVRERIQEETGCRYCVIHVDPAGGDTKEQDR